MNVFIAGTGTDIGKTFVACKLLQLARESGIGCRGLKPVASGFDEQHLTLTDAGRLLLAAGQSVSTHAIDDINPWRFAAPVSPDRAAAIEGRTIEYAELVTFCRVQRQSARLCVIEGAGGLLTPIGEHYCFLDLISDLDLTVLLVIGSYLGTLSHSFSAIDTLIARKIRIVTCVNQSDDDVEAFRATCHRVGSYTGVSPCECMRPRLEQASTIAGLIPDILNRLDQTCRVAVCSHYSR